MFDLDAPAKIDPKPTDSAKLKKQRAFLSNLNRFVERSMKFAQKSLIAVAAFMALGVAQAATRTLAVGETIEDSGTNGAWSLSELSGTGKLTFSNQLINALNTAKVTFAEVAPAKLTAPYIAGTTNYQKDGAVFATTPVSSLSGDFDGNTLQVTTVQTTGGAQQITVKNGATTGAGNLTISNLRVVIGDRAGFAGTIYADLTSTTAGFTNRTSYALWSFDQLIGPTTFTVPTERVTTTFDVANSLHGLFLVNSTEGKGLFQQALLLNSVGLSALNAVENRASTTNIDPKTGKVAGWGNITSNIKVIATPVPEPTTYALMIAGLAGLGMVARRRAAR